MTDKTDRPAALCPFATDAEYVEYTLTGFIAARVARISAEKALWNATRSPSPKSNRILCRKKTSPANEAEQRVNEALVREAHAVVEYAQRLEAHRQTPGSIKLGFDRTAEAFAINRDEELILFALCAPAICPSFAERTLGGLELRYFSGGLMVDDLITLLDPESLSDRIKFRQYFHRASRLNQHELISITFHGGLKTPDEFIEGQVKLSPVGFGFLLGLAPDFLAGESETVADPRETQV